VAQEQWFEVVRADTGALLARYTSGEEATLRAAVATGLVVVACRVLPNDEIVRFRVKSAK
jgi:hypothetical protein